MSWPADGRPRYKLAVTKGWSKHGRVVGVSIAILDRAYCHREVHVWRTDRAHVPYAVIEDRAYATLIELNARG